MSGFIRTKERLVYQNPFLELFDDEVTLPSGKPGTYLRLRYHGNPPGVVIVPRLADGRYLLLSVARYAANEVSLEFPRGSAETNENAEEAARRELKEETGLSSASCVFLGYLRPDTAIVETEVRVFLAEMEQADAIALDPGEGITAFRWSTLAEVWESVRTGGIRDGFTIGALGLLAAHQAVETL